mmetsp:Transcript_31266/g.79739  ORF Transcript_31266/g.79739 Transcript_31266/m.79739 type:complete len:224 (-) Transcript_31266:2308-2979(-)
MLCPYPSQACVMARGTLAHDLPANAGRDSAHALSTSCSSVFSPLASWRASRTVRAARLAGLTRSAALSAASARPFSSGLLDACATICSKSSVSMAALGSDASGSLGPYPALRGLAACHSVEATASTSSSDGTGLVAHDLSMYCAAAICDARSSLACPGSDLIPAASCCARALRSATIWCSAACSSLSLMSGGAEGASPSSSLRPPDDEADGPAGPSAPEDPDR